MPDSVIEAIKQGIWNFEPQPKEQCDYGRTNAMPGTPEKLEVLASRLRRGVPLWHPQDRIAFLEGEGKEGNDPSLNLGYEI